jgi:7-cyano-7-deazaguanine synthase in queuosine biosynthesis
MSQIDYTYTFADLSDGFTSVEWIHHGTHRPAHMFRVRLGDQQIHQKRQHNLSALLADCIDLALAVAVADRLSTRTGNRRCGIHICLPVRQLEHFGSAQTQQLLQEILDWYTQDQWTFHFSPRSHYGHRAEIQPALFSSPPDSHTEVALWSGGLDSLAGLYSRLKSGEASTHYILFGTGANTYIYRKQQEAALAIARLFPGRTTLVQIPLWLDKTRKLGKHPLQRSRGFVFLFLGAVCAALEGQRVLFSYENGIGAINLPFSQAEVGLDHSRSVHPVSLIRMGEFTSHLFGSPFTFQNPFFFQTKAQMCADLTTSPAFEQLVLSTLTCDRYRRERPQQCGRCSSCLLRRQAIAVLNIEDPTPYTMTTASLNGRESRLSDGDYLRAMLTQVVSLRSCFAAGDPWERLSEYAPQLLEIVDEMDGKEEISRATLIDRLVHLYERYVSEWEEHVCQAVYRGFTENLIEIKEITGGD